MVLHPIRKIKPSEPDEEIVMEGKHHMKRMIAATLTLALTTAALAG